MALILVRRTASAADLKHSACVFVCSLCVSLCVFSVVQEGTTFLPLQVTQAPPPEFMFDLNATF